MDTIMNKTLGGGINAVKDNYLYLIILLIGFQQFPVLRIGGSFKLYEILAIFVLIYDVLIFLSGNKSTKQIASNNAKQLSIMLLLFFIMSPLISYVTAIFNDYPYEFFVKYPDEESSFRFNYYFFPLLTLVYMFFNYSVFNGIMQSDRIYERFEKVIKVSIYIGSFIAIYALFAIFVYDFVAKLPDFLQNKKSYIMRANGFSQEPGAYVLYQSWIVLFTFFSRNLFIKKSWWLCILILNIITLIATFSTTLVALIAVIFISFFIFKTSLKRKIWITMTIIVFLFIVWLLLVNSANYEYLETFFINKLTNFFTAPDHTLDSGSFRSYTSRIGLAIFRENPLFGVGVGDSVYYMHFYENKMGIITFGETLFAGSFPQNTFSIILSEQGLFGISIFICLLIKLTYMFWKYRNYNDLTKMFFIGYIFNISTLITIAPVYSVFLWVFPAFGMGYILRIEKRINSENIHKTLIQNG